MRGGACTNCARRSTRATPANARHKGIEPGHTPRPDRSPPPPPPPRKPDRTHNSPNIASNCSSNHLPGFHARSVVTHELRPACRARLTWSFLHQVDGSDLVWTPGKLGTRDCCVCEASHPQCPG